MGAGTASLVRSPAILGSSSSSPGARCALSRWHWGQALLSPCGRAPRSPPAELCAGHATRSSRAAGRRRQACQVLPPPCSTDGERRSRGVPAAGTRRLVVGKTLDQAARSHPLQPSCSGCSLSLGRAEALVVRALFCPWEGPRGGPGVQGFALACRDSLSSAGRGSAPSVRDPAPGQTRGPAAQARASGQGPLCTHSEEPVPTGPVLSGVGPGREPGSFSELSLSRPQKEDTLRLLMSQTPSEPPGMQAVSQDTGQQSLVGQPRPLGARGLQGVAGAPRGAHMFALWCACSLRPPSQATGVPVCLLGCPKCRAELGGGSSDLEPETPAQPSHPLQHPHSALPGGCGAASA